MSKYLRLPVKFINEEGAKEIERLKELNIECNEDDYATDGTLYVNPDQIVSFNKDEEGNTNLVLSDGYGHMILTPFEEFLELVNN